MGLFDKLFFTSKNSNLLGLPQQEPVSVDKNGNKTIQTLATFDLTLEPPKIYGDLPDPIVKFYPMGKN